MSLSPAVLDAMLASGCTADQIVAAVKAASDDDMVREQLEREAAAALKATKREADAARKRLKREAVRNRPSDSSGHDRTDADSSGHLSPPEVFPQTPFPNPSNPKPPSAPKGASSPTPRQRLMAVLDAERADALVEHRNRIRKPMTSRAAELLAAKLAKCPDPNAAADAIIENGWMTFEPEWIERRNQPRGSPANADTQNAALQRLAETMRSADVRPDPSRRSDQQAVLSLPAAAGRGW